MSETPETPEVVEDTRKGLDQAAVDELVAILDTFTDAEAELSVAAMFDLGLPVGSTKGETAKESLKRVADAYPFEVASAALMGTLTAELVSSLR